MQWDPIHMSLPDCVLPLIFSASDREFPYGMAGTGFLARYNSRAYFVTARHCLGENQEKIQNAVDNLCLPLSSSTHDVFPLREWGDAKVVGDLPSAVLPGGHFDLVVISIDASLRRVAEAFNRRAINLPPTGEWFYMAEAHLRSKLPAYQDKLLLEVRGFPRNGTNSEVDFEKQLIVTQGVVLRGHASWDSVLPHTKSISFLPEHCPVTDFDGISGAPVFIPLRGDAGFSYSLAGMMIRASNMRGHFVTVPWLVSAVRAAISDG